MTTNSLVISLAGGLICALALQTGSAVRAQTSHRDDCQPPAGENPGSSVIMRDQRTRAWKFLLENSRKPVYDSPDWVPKATAFRQPWRSAPSFHGPPLYFTEEFAAAGLRPSMPDKDLSTPDMPSADALIYESTFFNLAAVRHIENEHYPLYSPNQGTMARLLGESRTEIPEFPRDSVVVKTFWRPVSDQGKGPVKVGVWQWTALRPHDYGPFPETNWGHAQVCVELDRRDGSRCLDAKTSFVTLKTTAENGPGFTCPSSVPADCPKLRKGTTLLLLAMHVASKEKPDWFWATFWWKGIERTNGASPEKASWTCDNAQRPSALAAGPWSNYSLNLTTGFKQRKPDVLKEDLQTCGEPPIIGLNEQQLAAYNPFVEGVMINGRKSSCIDCHSRAYNNNTDRFDIPDPCSDGEDKPKLEDFQGKIRTDYLWTVANPPMP
jgi:hypothetical protein